MLANPMATLLLFYTLIILNIISRIEPKSRCFTCEGPCFSKEVCNCQTGMCESDYCYAERRSIVYSDGVLKYRIAKGCMKHPVETNLGCDYLSDRSTVFCVCQGHFCNDNILLPPRALDYTLWNTSCQNCPRKAHQCHSNCMGAYCSYDERKGTSSCGYGSPKLPFMYRTESLVHNPVGETCIRLETGTQLRAQCVCDRNNCNKQRGIRHQKQRSLSTLRNFDHHVQTYTCWSCNKQQHGVDTLLPSQCHKRRCRGQYCVLSLTTRQGRPHQRGSIGMDTGVARTAGCFNTSNRDLVFSGCTQSWRTDVYEEITCLCRGDYCNSDLHTAHINGQSLLEASSLLLTLFLLLFL